MRILNPIRRRRGRAAAAIATLAVVTTVLAGCSSGSSSSADTASASGPTVSVWSWRSQDKPLWAKVQKTLRAEGTDLTIKFRSISATSYDSVLKTAMNGGSGPDIFYSRAGNGTQTYAAAGLIKPIDNIADTDGMKSASLAAAKYKGKTYGVPFAVQTMSMFYNKKVLSDAGIKKPTTWEELISAMKKLKAKGVTPMYTMGVQQWLMSLQLQAIGASTVDNATAKAIVEKKTDYSNPQFVKSLAAFQQLELYLQNNWQATGSAGNEQETAFALGKTAFIIDGIFDTGTIDQVNPDLDYGQMLIPSPNKTSAKMTWYVDGNISMNASIASKAVEKASEKVLKYTATKKFGNQFSSIAGEISPIAGVTISKKYPLSVQAAHWYNTKGMNPVIGIRSPMDTPDPDPSSLKKKKAVSTTSGVYTAEQDVVVPLLEGKITPKQAAAEINGKLDWYFKG